MTKARIGGVIMAAGMLCGALWTNAPAAMAVNGKVINDFGYTHFDDGANDIDVCDTRTDHIGVSGRISVQQADGSWFDHEWHRDGNGNNGDCAGGYEVINRESAKYKLTICAQNGAGTPRYACFTASFNG
jgi:hypothetical protein